MCVVLATWSVSNDGADYYVTQDERYMYGPMPEAWVEPLIEELKGMVQNGMEIYKRYGKARRVSL
jgi:hypothetical protein